MLVLEVKGNHITIRKAKYEDLKEATYTLLNLIPIGKVSTYKDIALILNKSPRIIGKILKENDKPIIIPCHRVVDTRGYLRGYSLGGLKVKEKLLSLEGVRIKDYKVSRKYFISLSKILGFQ